MLLFDSVIIGLFGISSASELTESKKGRRENRSEGYDHSLLKPPVVPLR